MVDNLNFLRQYFRLKRYIVGSFTIVIDETPCYEFGEDEYSFKVQIAECIDEVDIIYRDIAIEDHPSQIKHAQPHIQFKLHSDKIGKIHISLPIDNIAKYEKYILSFLDIISNVLIKLDENKDLQKNFMIMDNFNKIKDQGEFIKDFIHKLYKKEGIKIVTPDKDERSLAYEDIQKIKQIPQMLPFFEKINVE